MKLTRNNPCGLYLIEKSNWPEKANETIFESKRLVVNLTNAEY